MKEAEIVNRAQNVMKKLFEVDENGNSTAKNVVTTSQIRKFLTAVGTITEKVNAYRFENPKNESELSEELQAEIKFLKVKLAYQIGRNKTKRGNPVKDFEKEADLINEIDAINKSTKAWQIFANYMEALVAFHKFYGGRDK